MARIARPWNELTPQQQLNRQRNEAAKAKRENVFNITGKEMPKNKADEPSIKHHRKEESQSSNKWASIVNNLIDPKVVFPLICLTGISSYLVWQFYQTPSGDLLTGIIIELLGIIYATIFTVSNSKFVRFISCVAIICTILYTSVILHGGLKTNHSKSDDSINSLVIERDAIQQLIKSKTKAADELPSGYASKKQSIMSDVNKDIEKLSSINIKLESIKKSNEGDVFAGLIIRILSMLANAYMVHLVVRNLTSNKIAD